MAELLTTNLRLELEKTNQQFNRWADNQREWLQSRKDNYEANLEELECTIQALQKTNAELEASRPDNDRMRFLQEQEIQQIRSHQDLLRTQIETVDKQLHRAEQDEMEANQAVSALRIENDRLKQQIEQKLYDFTYGVQHFLHLGLEFQKAANDCMKFNFINIDSQLPARVFSFIIFVDHTNLYQLVETIPQLRTDSCLAAVSELNRSNNIAKFVVMMRRMFKDLRSEQKLIGSVKN